VELLAVVALFSLAEGDEDEEDEEGDEEGNFMEEWKCETNAGRFGKGQDFTKARFPLS